MGQRQTLSDGIVDGWQGNHLQIAGRKELASELQHLL